MSKDDRKIIKFYKRKVNTRDGFLAGILDAAPHINTREDKSHDLRTRTEFNASLITETDLLRKYVSATLYWN